MATPSNNKKTQRFLGNTNTNEVHDTLNEQTNCQLDEIIVAGHGVSFSPDTLDQAHAEGYDNGHWCIGGSMR